MIDNSNQNHTFVVDITKHKNLTDTSNLISSVREYVRSKFNTARLIWTVRPEQKAYLDNDSFIVDSDTGLTLMSGDKIRNWINKLSQDGSAGHIFHVLSYDFKVLNAAADLNKESFVVTTGFLKNIYKPDSEILNSEINFANNIDASSRNGFEFTGKFKPITLNEAIELAKKVLRDGGHFSPSTALRLAVLRTEMIKLDFRARKNPSDPSSVYLMRYVFNDGLKKGWLRIDTRYKQGGEHVWLVDDTLPRESFSNKPTDAKNFNPALYKLSAQLPAVSSSGNGLNYYNFEETVSSEQPVEETVSEEYKNVEVAEIEVEPTPKPVPQIQTQPKRCTLMEMKLREQGIGSPAVPRSYLFDAVEQIFKEMQDVITASRLIVLAREKAKAKALAEGYNRQQNWEAIADCFMRMMLFAKVLIKSDGTPVSNGIGGYSDPVKEILPDFRDRCEAFLIEHIVNKLGDVTLNDLFALGLALYQRGADNPTPKEEIVMRTDFLLKLLYDAGRIKVDGEGNISVLKC